MVLRVNLGPWTCLSSTLLLSHIPSPNHMHILYQYYCCHFTRYLRKYNCGVTLLNQNATLSCFYKEQLHKARVTCLTVLFTFEPDTLLGKQAPKSLGRGSFLSQKHQTRVNPNKPLKSDSCTKCDAFGTTGGSQNATVGLQQEMVCWFFVQFLPTGLFCLILPSCSIMTSRSAQATSDTHCVPFPMVGPSISPALLVSALQSWREGRTSGLAQKPLFFTACKLHSCSL